MEGMRARGRPKKMWNDCVKEDLGKIGVQRLRTVVELTNNFVQIDEGGGVIKRDTTCCRYSILNTDREKGVGSKMPENIWNGPDSQAARKALRQFAILYKCLRPDVK